MTQAQLLHEFSQLSLQQQIEVLQAALQIVGQHVQVGQHSIKEASDHQSLAEAAASLVDEYQHDEELTSFTALDGESFYAER